MRTTRPGHVYYGDPGGMYEKDNRDFMAVHPDYMIGINWYAGQPGEAFESGAEWCGEHWTCFWLRREWMPPELL